MRDMDVRGTALPRERGRGILSRCLRFLGYCLFCFIAIAAGTIAGWIHKSPVMTSMALALLNKPDPVEAFNGQESVNLLILGCDDDLAPGGKKVLLKTARSDMMLLARLDFKSQTVAGLSIPRDTLCRVPGFRRQKINAYHAIGMKVGPEEGKRLSKKAVETLLGVPVDQVVVLDFDAFQSLVNTVGGVDLDVEKHLKYTDRAGGLFIDIQPGKQHLDGYNSMCFVRYRHGDDDFHRQARQQQFLFALKKALVGHWSVLPAAADEAVRVFGGGLTQDQVVALAFFGRSLDSNRVQMGTIPVVNASHYNLAVNKKELGSMLASFGFRAPSRVARMEPQGAYRALR